MLYLDRFIIAAPIPADSASNMSSILVIPDKIGDMAL
jgi:hypothetical protein